MPEHASSSPNIERAAAYPELFSIIELLKPITWFAAMWAFMCGVVSSGVVVSEHLKELTLGMLLVGPLVCGMSQAANDWFDRHVDAINEPDRPIPSGRIPGRWGLYIAVAWTFLSLLVAGFLGSIVFIATLFGVAIAWAYSAPPFRLKQNGWYGNAACGLGYEGMPWVTGTAVMISAVPRYEVIFLALLYSVGAHGIMTLNDFKAIEGDKQMGVRSLPVQLGAPRAAKFACFVMAAPQVAVIALLLSWGKPFYAMAIAILVFVQLLLMHHLLTDPRKLAPWYNATGVTLFVSGMLICAFAVRSLTGV